MDRYEGYNVTVENNVFEYDGGVRLVVKGKKNITLADNAFRHGNASQQCYVHVEAEGDADRVLVSSNTFQVTPGVCSCPLRASVFNMNEYQS